MSHPRAISPIILGAGQTSRLLLERFVSVMTLPRPQPCLGCGFTLSSQRQLRYYSSNNTEPPKPPNTDSFYFGDLKPKPEPEAQPEPISSSDASQPQPQPPNPTNLPSHGESRRSHISQRFNSFMDRAQATLFTASRQINDLTGYSGIETLKSQIAALESNLLDAQSRLHKARVSYKEKVAARSAMQRETTTLLARQKTWTPADFERFTTLYRQDYELEAAVNERARELEEAEMEAERLGRELNAGILARYHEEQIWSDKIRRMSTWGTWGLMGVNVLLFLVFQFGAEPWRRARLVKGFEERVRSALEEEREKDRLDRTIKDEIAAMDPAAVDRSSAAKVSVAELETMEQPTAVPKPAFIEEESLVAEEQPAISWKEALRSPTWWKETAIDLMSDRKIAVRVRDISLIALEGVVTGAAVASAVAVYLIRRA